MQNSIRKARYFMDVPKHLKNVKVNFSMLRQRKLICALRTLGKRALSGGWTARAGEGSAIGYIKDETALWACQRMLRLRNHLMSLDPDQTPNEILKKLS